MRDLQRILCSTIALLMLSGFSRAQTTDLSGFEETVQLAGLGIDDASLLRFLELRSRDAVDPAELEALIEKLASKSFKERLKASRDLISLGALAIPALRTAARDVDNYHRSRLAKRCLATLTGNDNAQLPIAVSTLLAHRKTKDAMAAIMNYLPYAQGEEGIEQLRDSILILAGVGGKETHPAIAKALKSPTPLLRALAIDILRRQGVAFHLETLRGLLKDKRPTVRLQAALALTQHKEENAVSTLIDLLTELPYSHAQKAESALSGLAEDRGPNVTLTADATEAVKVQKSWRDWWDTETSGEKLLQEVSKRTITEETRKQTEKYIEMFRSDSFDEREAASKGLRELGAAAAQLLRVHAKDSDPEVRYRVQACLTAIDEDSGGPLSPVVTRLLAFRKPEGMAKVLLQYLPLAEDETIAKSVQDALKSVAYRDGKANPEILQALTSKNKTLRGAAGHALCQPGHPDQIKAAKELLNDPEWKVRMNVALALAYLKDRSAMPTLIDSLAHLSEEEGYHANEYLFRLAGEKIPDGVYSTSATARSKAWKDWWKENGSKVALLSADAQNIYRRFQEKILIISYNYGAVAEYDRNGKKLWEIRGLSSPRDAHVIRRNRVLILEYSTRQLTERDFKGKIHWKQTIPAGIYPVSMQHLRNGNNLIVGYNRIVEMTRTGRIVFDYRRPQNDLRTARKLRNGQVLAYCYSGAMLKLNRQAKVMKSWSVRSDSSNYGYQILENGNVLIPLKYNSYVYEYDTNGKMIWSRNMYRPESMYRLPDGRTVVGWGGSPYYYSILDRTGKKELKKVQLNITASRIQVR